MSGWHEHDSPWRLASWVHFREARRMDSQVFISYARGTSRAHAEALHRTLGADVAFLDTSGVEAGGRFPAVLAEALLGARLIVVFVDETYFTRWYCLWELRTALAPFLALPPGASEPDKALALAPLVLALPPEGGAAALLERLPPRLRELQWPGADQTERLAQWILAGLEGERLSIGARLERLGRLEETRARLLQESVLPPPETLAGLRLHPLELPPSIGASFVGREDDLWRIDFALTASRAGEGTAAALSGALEAGGGFGKTRLALEYLHRLGPRRFPGGLFWVDADVSAERLEEQHHGILRTLRPDVPPLPGFREQRREAARELAEALHGLSVKEPVLYVVDNVPEPGPGERPRPLKTWCPALGKVALLVTSRARFSLGTESVQPIPVSTLAPDAAVALLTEKVERSSLAGADWLFITEWVGHLPLALELLNRAMQAGAITPAELLEKARHVGPALELDRQMEALRAHIPEGQLRGVTEALSISYERLIPEAQRAAECLAQLSPAPIPVALLDVLKPLFTPQVRTLLTMRSFVTGATRGAVPSFGAMHRVLADFLRSRASAPDLGMGMMGVVLTQFMAPELHENPEAWPLLDACAPHAEWLFERLTTSPQRELGLALGQRLGGFRARRGLVGPAADIRRSVAKQAHASFGDEHRATLAAKSDHGEALRQSGDLQGARKVLAETLEVQRRVFGEEHPETLTVMNNLSLALADLGEPEARPLAERVLSARLRLLGEEHPETLHSMSNLATILWDLGDVAGSRSLHERVLAIRRRILGETHQDTLLSKTALATTLRKQGDLRAARAMQEPLLEEHIQVLGREHPETLIAMNNLAVTLFSLSELAAARRVQEEALEISTRVLGEQHPSTLGAKRLLAHILRKQGERIRAHALYEQALHGRCRMLGEAHPDTLDSWRDLFESSRDQGDLPGSRQIQERLLRILEKTHGIQAEPTVTMAWWIFCAFDHLDDFATAQGILDKYLFWLLESPPDKLEPELRKSREQVARLMRMPGTPYRRGAGHGHQ